jgi:hypothetical protein
MPSGIERTVGMNQTVAGAMKNDCWRRDGWLSGELLFDIVKCRILWQLWSPNWQFGRATFDASIMQTSWA